MTFRVSWSLIVAIGSLGARGSITFTSNHALEEGPDLFGVPLLASAGLGHLSYRHASSSPALASGLTGLVVWNESRPPWPRIGSPISGEN